MKNRTIFTLLLAVVVIVAVPVFAQDNSASQTQPATQSTSMQPAAPAATKADSATGKDPLQPETREGFWGRMNPFARKKYVARQTQPIRDRINELDELTASNTRADQGYRCARAAGNSARFGQSQRSRSTCHRRRQQGAGRTADRTTGAHPSEHGRAGGDQYRSVPAHDPNRNPFQNQDKTVLSQNAKTALDEMATPLKNQRGYVVEVQGFSSGHGQAAISTSQKMAESVVRYLALNHDIPIYRIYLVGMAMHRRRPRPAMRSRKRITGGRVEISLLKKQSGATGFDRHDPGESRSTVAEIAVPFPEKASRENGRLFLCA